MDRRELLIGVAASTAALGLAGCNTTGNYVSALAPMNEEFPVPRVNMARIPRQYHRQRVQYETNKKPGSVVVDVDQRYLHFIEPDGMAIRYGIGVGREGFAWKGTASVGRKAKWPTWTPPSAMIRRQPELAIYRGGMPGGVDNPLGARALYLFRGGRDTLYRLHGTNEPWSIGQAMSSGCVRMLNHDVIDLYERCKIGSRVYVS
ncbi:MAG: L,D-transpeptidase [Hyphomicrobiales bacterium]|nr:L,D-transpeptidase [Hyphomicrobiales bacterium]